MNIFETKDCTGCKTCEIACAFHHTRRFSTSSASIKIFPREKKLGFAIGFYKKNKGPHLACNGCKNETEPWCVKYCPSMAKAELLSIMQKTREEFQPDLA